MAYNHIDNLNIENAKLVFKAFMGDRYDKRSFGVILEDEHFAQELNEEGWNVHYYIPKSGDSDPFYYLPVEIRFDKYPPRIHMYTDGAHNSGVEINEANMSSLAEARIVYCDLVIGPSVRMEGDTQKIKAYLKHMHAVIAKPDDVFAEKYAYEEHPEE